MDVPRPADAQPADARQVDARQVDARPVDARQADVEPELLTAAVKRDARTARYPKLPNVVAVAVAVPVV